MRILNRCCSLLLCLVFVLAQHPLRAAEGASPMPPASGQVSAPIASPSSASSLLSFDFVNADLSTVLKAIAYSYDLNLVVATEIKGKVNARLKDVSLDEAFQAILRMNKYGFTRKESIVYIVPEDQVELVTEYIPLNFILAKDAQKLLTKDISKRGEIQIDEGGNRLVVTDIPENIKKVKAKMPGIDQPPLQVMIEAKIVDIKTSDAKNIGTAFGGTYSPGQGNLSSSTVTVGAAATTVADGALLELVPNFRHLADASMTIDALVQQHKGRVLASPSIATLNGQEARIIIGNKYPYQQSSVTGSTTAYSTQFLDVGTTLKVTPMISPEGWITMKIHPEVSSATPSSAGPVVSTREADATIRVKDKETIVIGGLISSDDSVDNNGVPGLSSVPVLGWLFKRHSTSDSRTELMVFITPHIMRSPEQKTTSGAVARTDANPPKADLEKQDLSNEVRIDQAVLSQGPEILSGLLDYASVLEEESGKKGKDNLYLKLELLKTYKVIAKDFPQSGKGDYCLFKIASLYVKDFGKCGAAQEALTQLEDRFPGSSYIDATQAMVQKCPKEAFIIREEAPVKILKK